MQQTHRLAFRRLLELTALEMTSFYLMITLLGCDRGLLGLLALGLRASLFWRAHLLAGLFLLCTLNRLCGRLSRSICLIACMCLVLLLLRLLVAGCLSFYTNVLQLDLLPACHDAMPVSALLQLVYAMMWLSLFIFLEIVHQSNLCHTGIQVKRMAIKSQATMTTSTAGGAGACHLRTSAGSRQHLLRALVSPAACRDGMQCKDEVLQWLHKQDICDASCKVRISSSARGGGRSLQANVDVADEVELLAIPESYWFSEPAQVLCSNGHSIWACRPGQVISLGAFADPHAAHQQQS